MYIAITPIPDLLKLMTVKLRSYVILCIYIDIYIYISIHENEPFSTSILLNREHNTVQKAWGSTLILN